ncbi:MAG: hypothetical protein COB03_08980 [Alteromonas sp.]|nr:MAG: hypothetical protein COB03_08980 [Alteromonas sp.]
MNEVKNLSILSHQMLSFTIRYREQIYRKDDELIVQTESDSVPKHHDWVGDAFRHFGDNKGAGVCTIYTFATNKSDHQKVRFLLVGDHFVSNHLIDYFQEKTKQFIVLEGLTPDDEGMYEIELHETGAPYGTPTFHVENGCYYYRYQKKWYEIGPLRTNAFHSNPISKFVADIDQIDFRDL